jgi:hypothetical protein
VNAKLASRTVTGVENAPPPIFWQFEQWQL